MDTANGRRQLQQCHLETTFSDLCLVRFKSQKKKKDFLIFEKEIELKDDVPQLLYICVLVD